MRAERGRLWESRAAAHLESHGLEILTRGYRCRLGEIDLVAEERGVLVFAEVRMRRAFGFGGAGASVTAAKRARLLAAARLYLTRRPEMQCRFDVFLVDGPAGDIKWIRDAFGE